MRVTSRHLSTLLPALLVIGLAPLVTAQGPAGTYLQAAFADWEDYDNGYSVSGSYLANEQVRFFAEYIDTDLEHLRAGGGYIFPLENNLSLELGGSYNEVETGFFDEEGFGVHGIARLETEQGLTLSGRLEELFFDELNNETVVGFGADYGLTSTTSVFAEYDLYLDEFNQNLFTVGARLHF